MINKDNLIEEILKFINSKIADISYISSFSNVSY